MKTITLIIAASLTMFSFVNMDRAGIKESNNNLKENPHTIQTKGKKLNTELDIKLGDPEKKEQVM